MAPDALLDAKHPWFDVGDSVTDDTGWCRPGNAWTFTIPAPSPSQQGRWKAAELARALMVKRCEKRRFRWLAWFLRRGR